MTNKFPSKSDYIVKSIGKWKPIPVTLGDDGGDFNDFEGLITIEELNHYDVNKSDKLNYNKRPKIKNDHENDGDDEGCDKIRKKKKRKKINKHKKKSQLKCAKMESESKSKGNDSPPPKSIKPIDEQLFRNKSHDADTSMDMSAWNDLLVPECVIRALRELKFDSPTPIQTLAIPSAVRDRLDILGAAETGSGKTLAFGIPLIHFILKDKELEWNDDNNKCSINKLRALILTPTRELAIQVMKHIDAVAKYSNVNVNVIVGGMSLQKQERIINKKCPDILVATPGRLWEFVEKNGHLNVEVISNLKYIVIDEADRMTEKGHFRELSSLFELVRERNVKGRQIFVFSATLTLIHALPERLRFSHRKKTNRITQSQKLSTLIEMFGMREKHTKVIDLTRQGIGIPNEEMLTETRINCLTNEKDLYLYYFVCTYPGRTLVFCNSKDCLRRLVNVLKMLQQNPLSLHADMPQKKRLTNLERFTSHSNGLLIATDVASRGLDIANVDHVVHYQIPRTSEIYVHRSGRTARAYNKGLSLMLCDPKEEANIYKKLCQSLNKGIDLELFPIDHSTLKIMKHRVTLAQKCDRLDHKIRMENAKSQWFRNAAAQCDIQVDDDTSDFEDNSSNPNVKQIQQLKGMRVQLNSLLKEKLIRRNHLTTFVTKTGSIHLPINKGESAIDNVKKGKMHNDKNESLKRKYKKYKNNNKRQKLK